LSFFNFFLEKWRKITRIADLCHFGALFLKRGNKWSIVLKKEVEHCILQEEHWEEKIDNKMGHCFLKGGTKQTESGALFLWKESGALFLELN
jgi:hypothetical protein